MIRIKNSPDAGLYMKHVFLGPKPKAPIATREGTDQLVDEMWVGNSNRWELMGVMSTTMDYVKDVANRKTYMLCRLAINGTVLVERKFECVLDTHLGQMEILDEADTRTATIGELQ